MSDEAHTLINRLNVAIGAIVAMLVIIVLAGAFFWFSTQPSDVKKYASDRFNSLDKRIETLESKLEVRPADVMREVQELRIELRKLRDGKQ